MQTLPPRMSVRPSMDAIGWCLFDGDEYVRFYPHHKAASHSAAVALAVRDIASPPGTVPDYYGQPIAVGDVCMIVAVDPKGGTPLYATGIPLTVVAVRRTRVEVTGSTFNGTICPSAAFVAVKS